MLLLPPANWGPPFNPPAPNAVLELVPTPPPKGPVPCAKLIAVQPS